MKNLNLALLQVAMHWEDREANLRKYELLLDQAEEADVYMLPEMFHTGFSMRPEHLAVSWIGSTRDWLLEQSKKRNGAITGSFIVAEDGRFYNRLFWVQPDGVIYHYDKKHLFSLAGEEKVYAPGEERLIVSYKGWKICPLVCYDLRFPVWSRNRITKEGNPEYDVLLYVANWPERRNFPWKHLLIARAIENQAFVAGVNRVGEDGNGVEHSGDSAVHHPDGTDIVRAQPGVEQWLYATLSMEDLQAFRKRFQFLKDQDNSSFETL
jgi:predicted amidohydrolase